MERFETFGFGFCVQFSCMNKLSVFEVHSLFEVHTHAFIRHEEVDQRLIKPN